VITASTSGDKAHASLLLTLEALTASTLSAENLLIPYIKSRVNADGQIMDRTILAQLQELARSIERRI
jgi:hypothetical protein